ncbi:MAG TPA: phosphatase PAP2 family protein [Kofleriaceae bacterium]|nr:phosphatase PAP2 family protein [Kofleriaceae bacterium]
MMQTFNRHRRMALRRVTIAALLCFLVSSASAGPVDPEGPGPWYAGRPGRNRLLHLAITGAAGLAYLASVTVLRSSLTPSTCRWCEPPAFDRAVRNAVVWDNTGRAGLLSDVNVYVLSPIVGFGLLIASDHDAGWARLLDDTIPVAESIAVGQLASQTIKYIVGRQRPYVRFGTPGPNAPSDANTSFISGHSVLGFSITVSAGMICHWRHYRTEPYVWGAGIALSLSTEYLRMGADKHYLSDVLVGGLVGATSGFLIPRLMREDVQLVPIKNGVAVAGKF